MAIQMRRGKIAELDTSLVQSGELLVATDTDFVAYAKGQSDIVQLASKKDVINAVQSGTLVDVMGKKLIFRKNRSQPTVSFIRDYVVGEAYDIEYGDGLATVEFAIKEFLKCCKPYLLYRNVYEVHSSALKEIYKELKTIVSSTDFVNVTLTFNTSNYGLTLVVYYGSPRGEELRPSQKNSIDVRTGRYYYHLNSSQIYLNGEYKRYIISATGDYTVTTQSSFFNITQMGVYVDGYRLYVSNLGMKTDRVINDNDWEWDFAKCEVKTEGSYKRIYDLVDGLRATIGSGADVVDGQLTFTASPDNVYVPYLFQLGRTVEIDFGICERYKSGSSYPTGYVFGNAHSDSSSAQYMSLEMSACVEGGTPTMRIRGYSSYSDPVELSDPNILSQSKVISKMENNLWTITVNGVSVSHAYSRHDLIYSKIGRVSMATSYGSLYTMRIKKIKVN